MLDARMFDAEEMLAIREQYEERVTQAEARREELEWQVKRALVAVEEAEREARRAIDEMRRVVTGLSAAVSGAMSDEPKRLFDAPKASPKPAPAPRSAKSLDETPVKLTRSVPPPAAAPPVAASPRVISSAPPPEPAPRPVRKTPPPLPSAARKRPGHWDADEGTSPDAHSATLVGSAMRPAIRPAHAVEADTSRDLRPALRTVPAAPASAPPVVSSPVLGYRRLVR